MVRRFHTWTQGAEFDGYVFSSHYGCTTAEPLTVPMFDASHANRTGRLNFIGMHVRLMYTIYAKSTASSYPTMRCARTLIAPFTTNCNVYSKQVCKQPGQISVCGLYPANMRKRFQLQM